MRPGFNQQRNQTAVPARDFAREFRNEWISASIKAEAISFADDFARELNQQGSKFTTSQIRNFYGEVKRIQMKGFESNKTAFLLLKPKLSYAAAKAEGRGAKLFEGVMKKALEAVKPDDHQSEIRFNNFCDFFEAILAYHKAHGGK